MRTRPKPFAKLVTLGPRREKGDDRQARAYARAKREEEEARFREKQVVSV